MNENSRRLVVYSAFVPSIPLGEAARRFAEAEGVEVDVRPGRPETWLPRLRDGAPADLISCGAEFLLDLAEAEGIAAPGTRASLGRRRAAIVVPQGNPARVAGVEDLARPGVRLGIGVEGCTLGLWDEIGGRVAATEALRARIAARAPGCGALLGLVTRGEVDAAFGWHNFDRVPKFAVEIVELPGELAVWRSTGVAIPARAENRALAEEFVGFLTSEAGRQIYRSWGWHVP